MPTRVTLSAALADEVLRGGACSLPIGLRGAAIETAVTIVSVAGGLSSVVVARESWRAFATAIVDAVWRHRPAGLDETSFSVATEDLEVHVVLRSRNEQSAITVIIESLEKSELAER